MRKRVGLRDSNDSESKFSGGPSPPEALPSEGGRRIKGPLTIDAYFCLLVESLMRACDNCTQVWIVPDEEKSPGAAAAAFDLADWTGRRGSNPRSFFRVPGGRQAEARYSYPPPASIVHFSQNELFSYDIVCSDRNLARDRFERAMNMEQTERIHIDRPSKDVWDLVGDVRAWPTWLKDVENVTYEGELGLGTAVSCKWRGKDVSTVIASFEDGKKIAIESEEKSYDFHESISLHSLGNSTEVTLVMGFNPTVWWASSLAMLLFPVKSLLLGRPLKKELRNLKQAAESGVEVT